MIKISKSFITSIIMCISIRYLRLLCLKLFGAKFKKLCMDYEWCSCKTNMKQNFKIRV